MEGLGNDFILIDNIEYSIDKKGDDDVEDDKWEKTLPKPLLTPHCAQTLCSRRFGIGADGVVFVLPGTKGCMYSMRIYNADGSEPEMCGNAIRCVTKFVYNKEKEEKDVGDIKKMGTVRYSFNTSTYFFYFLLQLLFFLHT